MQVRQAELATKDSGFREPLILQMRELVGKAGKEPLQQLQGL